jgi:hypothetical protein
MFSKVWVEEMLARTFVLAKGYGVA